uniref:Uncharacterized protein n=1 Tax=Timema genevievae TaxID=629358 RepID=A0A7R9JMQ0_TIMGE|nr:unnamed protein product [Timema genevievae]
MFVSEEKEGVLQPHKHWTRSVPAFAWKVENHWAGGSLSTPDRDSNLDLPVIGSLAYYKSSALDLPATEEGHSLLSTMLSKTSRQKKAYPTNKT